MDWYCSSTVINLLRFLLTFAGWFPFLFYSTTWVGEVYFRYHPETNAPASKDTLGDVGRVGSLSLVVFSIITFVASVRSPLRRPIARSRPTEIHASRTTYHHPDIRNLQQQQTRPPDRLAIESSHLRRLDVSGPFRTVFANGNHHCFCLRYSLGSCLLGSLRLHGHRDQPPHHP